MIKDFKEIKEEIKSKLGVNYEVSEYKEKGSNNKWYEKLLITKKNSDFISHIILDFYLYMTYIKHESYTYTFPTDILVGYGKDTDDKFFKYFLPNFKNLPLEQKKIVRVISKIALKQSVK